MEQETNILQEVNKNSKMGMDKNFAYHQESGTNNL